ncbi:MAG TPA: peptidase dimerization domain protein, partial [Candidatus Dormibacteraeota bacterium]|nr:peptidase dimerization domain protein [Candidatus Dormibacteraeota bacterium]
MSAAIDATIRYVRESHDRYLQELSELISIPSVSADPAHRDDVERCARRLVEQMKAIGLDSELLATDGNPLAYGCSGNDPEKP